MTKSEIIAGLRKINIYEYNRILAAAITFLEQGREVMGVEELEKLIDDWNDEKNSKTNSYPIEPSDIPELAAALSNHIAKPLSPEPKLELPEEIDLKMVCYDDTLKLVIIINALIRYLKAKEGR